MGFRVVLNTSTFESSTKKDLSNQWGPDGSSQTDQKRHLVQVRFAGPEGTMIGWKTSDGFADNQLLVPASTNLQTGTTYRLKFANIPGREGLVLFPTLTLQQPDDDTLRKLQNSTISFELTDEELDEVVSHRLVTKVLFSPNQSHAKEFRNSALTPSVSSIDVDEDTDVLKHAVSLGTVVAIFEVGSNQAKP